jgi:hypothetical protein
LPAEPGGPEGVYDRVLRLVAKEAAGPLSGSIETVIAGADESLAAVAALRGPAECRGFLTAIETVVAKIGRQVALFKDAVADQAVLTLLSLVAISETIGSPLKLPSYDVEHRFSRFLVNKTFSSADKITVALLSLVLGRSDDKVVRFATRDRTRPAASGANPGSLVEILAAALKSHGGSKDVEPAWEAFLHGFPVALQDEKAEWRHLLLAARIVFGTLGGMPVGQVAEALHRRIAALAAEESA